MSSIIDGGVAVVTGAGGGIGRALAQALAKRCKGLALADRDAGSLAETAALCAQGPATISQHLFDVADAAAIARFPDEVAAAPGGATLLINNAGVALAGTFAQTDLADFEWLMAINFWGPVRLCKAFLPQLQRAPAAHIVNLSSLFGLVAPEGQTAYCASKFGVRGFSESLRHELAGSSVGLTVVHPGGVATNIARNARVPATLNSTELAERLARTSRLLTMAPAQAAQIILEGVARGAPRVLVGADAKRGDILQRLMPATYWKPMKKALARAMSK